MGRGQDGLGSMHGRARGLTAFGFHEPGKDVRFTNQSTSGQHRIRTCDLYGVKPAYGFRLNREKVLPVREKSTVGIVSKTRTPCNHCGKSRL